MASKILDHLKWFGKNLGVGLIGGLLTAAVIFYVQFDNGFEIGKTVGIRKGTEQALKSWDEEKLRRIEAFQDAESYYATLAHECTHWTRHTSRLDRSFGREKWGDEGYAREELVAELGSAFICADLELALEPREDHASYIESWLKVLKNDKKAIFSAAALAQRAADFLNGLQSEKSRAA